MGPDDDFEGMFRANVVSVVRCTRAALPELRKSRGMVVNLGSTIASRPGIFMAWPPAGGPAGL